MCLFECPDCGHRYIDAKGLDQAWFDQYYLTQYQANVARNSDDRWNALASFVAELVPGGTALDIGGLDGHLGKHVRNYGLTYEAMGVKGMPAHHYDVVILSHTLEHIYDITPTMGRVKAAMTPLSYLVIEVPIHRVYRDATQYDYHFQHVNKFRPVDLRHLLERFGFEVVESYNLPDYSEYKCWRVVGRLRDASS